MKIIKNQVINNKWFRPKGFMSCCDCGLVHSVSYRISKGYLEMKVCTKKKMTKVVREKYFNKL